MTAGIILVLGLYPLLEILFSERQSASPPVDDGRDFETILMTHASSAGDVLGDVWVVA